MYTTYALLLLSSLLHITTCTVYTVTPDDHYYPNTTCHHCHNLQHYLLNVTKYFTSNTQLLFLPGLHHLHTDLIIQNVHNISLIGSTANGTTLDTVIIQCNSSVGIVMTNITNLTMENMVIRNCMTKSSQIGIKDFKNDTTCVILLFGCFKVHMQCMEIYNTQLKRALVAYNILGTFTLNRIKSKQMKIVYTDNYTNSSTKINQTVLNINQFKLIFMKTETTSNNNAASSFDVDDVLRMYGFSSVYNPLCSLSYYAKYFVNPRQTDSIKAFGIMLEILQTSYSVSAIISNSTFENYDNLLDRPMHFFLDIKLNSCNRSLQNIIYIQDCKFVNNRLDTINSLFSISSLSCDTAVGKKDIIKILNCNFINNTKAFTVSTKTSVLNVLNVSIEIYISGCLFQNDLLTFLDLSLISHSILFIENSKFEFITTTDVIKLYNVQLILIGPVVFSNITASQLISTNSDVTKFESITTTDVIKLYNVQLILRGPIVFNNITASQLISTNSDVTIHNYIEYSNVKASNILSGKGQTKINLIDGAYVNITNSDFSGPLFKLESSKAYSYPLCHVQYYKEEIKGRSKLDHRIPLILIDSSNNISETFDENIGNTNCKWDPQSLYYGSNPLKIYEQSVQWISNDNNNFDTGLLCHCYNGTRPNCSTNTLGPLYPGQSLEIWLALNSKVTNQGSVPISVKIYDEDFPHSLCIVKSMSEAEQLVHENCTKLAYNIYSESQTQCVLILYNIEYKFPTIYYVNIFKCPAGFALDNITKKCDCDQHLKSYGITDNCDINNQTILRPANSWISATTHNNSYTYHISLHCPFHYCLPHSSNLNFSTPNSQCQFNRSGPLCGHCQQGLSTVFSSYSCQYCTNTYLLLIIPIIIAGLIMVLLLFYLNLTVTDGSINAFILYANIISINTPVFFSSLNNFTPTYTFISLANLDLGIQTCFYNGMDDYAKMWLQLAFPFYLIFIATLIIITSRYSTRVQRLTARRAIPVLATLFLLSYTKILRVVSSVLFFYSTITHLPSKHTTLVWSVDASLPLFGIKFITLFVLCIALFCALIPFNAILVFTKTLSWLNLINKFTPLIDAYRGPYEYELYYWTGFQLIIRSVFFGISALNRTINLALGIVLISTMIGIHGIMCPYKSTAQNLQELLYLFNLQALYTITLYGRDTTNMTAVNILIVTAAVQLSIIFTYHIITYMCNGMIRNKIRCTVNMLRASYIGITDDQQYELSGNLSSNIPEVTYNYQEYREPLICQN